MITDFLSELVTLCRKHKVIRIGDREFEIETRDNDGFYKTHRGVCVHHDIKKGICIGLKRELVEWAEPKEDR